MLSDPITFSGEQVRLELQIDWAEYDRRRRADQGPLCSPDALDLLFDLPEDLAVRVAELSPSAVEVLAEIPGWAAERDGDHVVRRYRPPAVVRTAFAAEPGLGWEAQLDALRWFTSLCPSLILVDEIADAFEALGPASAFGVGVGVVEADGWFELLAPTVNVVQITPNRWLMAECAVCHLTGWCEELRSTPSPMRRGR